MKVKIIAVGKLKEKYLKDGISEYGKRMSRFAKFEIVELPDEKHLTMLVTLKISKLWKKRANVS